MNDPFKIILCFIGLTLCWIIVVLAIFGPPGRQKTPAVASEPLIPPIHDGIRVSEWIEPEVGHQYLVFTYGTAIQVIKTGRIKRPLSKETP